MSGRLLLLAFLLARFAFATLPKDCNFETVGLTEAEENLLELLISNRPTHETEQELYAAIDMDGTLIFESSSFGFLEAAQRTRFFPQVNQLADPKKIIGQHFQRSHVDGNQFIATLFAGKSERDVSCWVQEELFPHGFHTVAFTRLLIAELEKNGVTPIIVTAAPTPLARAIVGALGLSHLRVLATEIISDNTQTLTKSTLTPIPSAEGKVLALIQQGITQKQLFLAVGDSEHDLPMLRFAQTGVCLLTATDQASRVYASQQRTQQQAKEESLHTLAATTNLQSSLR